MMLRKFLDKLLPEAGGAPAPYVLISPRPAAEEIEDWAAQFPKYDTIVGYSVLGHFFMRASGDLEYMVLHPFKKAAKSYGVFESLAVFERTILQDPAFAEYVMRPEHVAAVRKRVGRLKEEEIYIPHPYPFLGGSDAPETYSKGNVWVFMEIVAQMHGLGE